MVDFKGRGDSCCPLTKCCCGDKHREGVPLWYASSRLKTINRNGSTDRGKSIDIANSVHPGRDGRDRELNRAQSFCSMFKGDCVKKFFCIYCYALHIFDCALAMPPCAFDV